MASATYENIRVETLEGIATLTLQRPEKLNAYTAEMGDEVVDAFSRLRDDESVRAVIVTGAGRGFCAGVDLDELRARQAGEKQIGDEPFLTQLPLDLLDYPKPVIAAINGPAIGVGVTMTLPMDIRLAADTASLGLTFVRLGILPGLGSTHLLPRLVGVAKAQELVLTARVIPASEAAEIGLVNRVVQARELAKEARELATSIAAHQPEVVAAAKRALWLGTRASMQEAMQNERALSADLRTRGRGGS